MTAKVPTIDRGTATLGMMVAYRLRRKRKITITTRRDGQHQFEFNVGDRGLDVGGKVGEGSDVDARRQIGLQLRHQQLNTLDHADGVGAGLPLHVENHRRRLVHPGRLLGVLHPIHDVGDVVEKDGSIVAIGYDDIL